MLPKHNRIPSGKIRTVLSKGRRFQTEHLRCMIYPNDTDMFRCAIIVPSSFDKRAVYRNRLRRLISESVRLYMPRLKQNIDCILMPGRIAVDTQQAVHVMVEQICVQAAVFV